MSVPFMEAVRQRDVAAASREAGATVTDWLPGQLEHFVEYRLAQLADDPTVRQFLGRVLVLADAAGARHVIGTVGFHGPPDDAGRLEVGYSVQPEYRRQGFASEAVRAMFDWAAREHGVRRFVASISPTNEPSLRLASAFGFVRSGEHMDEVDGLEYEFEVDWPPSGASAPTGATER